MGDILSRIRTYTIFIKPRKRNSLPSLLNIVALLLCVSGNQIFLLPAQRKRLMSFGPTNDLFGFLIFFILFLLLCAECIILRVIIFIFGCDLEPQNSTL